MCKVKIISELIEKDKVKLKMLNSRQAIHSKKETAANNVSSSAASNNYYKIRTIQKLQHNT